MKLSILPVSLFGDIISGKMSIADWAALAQDAGADGYDISTLFWRDHTSLYIDSVRRELDEKRISIQPNMVCVYSDFSNPDPIERERQLDYLRRDIALASAFGFRYIRITAGMAHPGMDASAVCPIIADYFARANETAARYGITLVFENHAKPGAWPLLDCSFDPNVFLSICDLIKDSQVGVNFDTANAVACGADPFSLQEKVMPLVKTVHLNDTATKGCLSPVLIGSGLVDFDRVFDILRVHNFDGWVSIEEGSNHGEKGIRAAIKRARKYVPANI